MGRVGRVKLKGQLALRLFLTSAYIIMIVITLEVYYFLRLVFPDWYLRVYKSGLLLSIVDFVVVCRRTTFPCCALCALMSEIMPANTGVEADVPYLMMKKRMS